MCRHVMFASSLRTMVRLTLPVLVVAGILLPAAPAGAQRGAWLMPTAGWQWGGTLDYDDPYTGLTGEVHINAAPSYGGTLSVPIRPGYSGEISYWYQSSEVIARPSLSPSFKLFDLATHYVQISGVRDLGNGDARATPYAVGGLGLAVFDPTSLASGTYSSEWTFAMNAGAGLRVDMNDRVSLRLQGRFLLPTRWISGGAWFGTGGAGIAVNAAVLPQGDALVGLSIKLGS